jgi:hypothetical protein
MANTVAVFDPNDDPGIVEVIRLQTEEGLEYGCAWDVFYFRHSPNWTIELEWELKKMHSEGRPPVDLSTFGYPKM